MVQAAHYGAVEELLSRDPVVARMAAALAAGTRGNAELRDQMFGSDGRPTFTLMLRANERYTRFGGTVTDKHVGAVANAIVRAYGNATSTSDEHMAAYVAACEAAQS